jgi:hypothetical protein
MESECTAASSDVEFLLPPPPPPRTQKELEDSKYTTEKTTTVIRMANSGRYHQARQPPIVLTTETKLILLQKQLEGLFKGNFEFHITRNRARIITKEMSHFSATKLHFDYQKIPYSTFYPKFQKPVKAVVHQLHVVPVWRTLGGFDIISVERMTTNRRSSAEGTTTVDLPMSLITLPRTAESQDIFTLPSLCHIAIKVDPYKDQNVLTQCYSCQKFGHF